MRSEDDVSRSGFRVRCLHRHRHRHRLGLLDRSGMDGQLCNNTNQLFNIRIYTLSTLLSMSCFRPVFNPMFCSSDPLPKQATRDNRPLACFQSRRHNAKSGLDERRRVSPPIFSHPLHSNLSTSRNHPLTQIIASNCERPTFYPSA